MRIVEPMPWSVKVKLLAVSVAVIGSGVAAIAFLRRGLRRDGSVEGLDQSSRAADVLHHRDPTTSRRGDERWARRGLDPAPDDEGPEVRRLERVERSLVGERRRHREP
jgi:hypothetical protein